MAMRRRRTTLIRVSAVPSDAVSMGRDLGISRWHCSSRSRSRSPSLTNSFSGENRTDDAKDS